MEHLEQVQSKLVASQETPWAGAIEACSFTSNTLVGERGAWKLWIASIWPNWGHGGLDSQRGVLEIGNLRLIGLNPPTEFSPPR